MKQRDTDNFEAQRAKLTAIAYQMLGERAGAEDIVQDTWIQWNKADKGLIDSPAAWLNRVVTRLSIDVLRSARVRREQYVGPWLPEPIMGNTNNEVEDAFIIAKECELALLWAMERLSAEERSAFILRKAFDCEYVEISKVLEKSEVACRKIVSRASKQVKQSNLKFNYDPDQTAQMLQQFGKACLAQDHQQVLKLLAPDVIALTDGGGRVRASLRPLVGSGEVAQVIMALSTKLRSSELMQFTFANKQPAIKISGSDQNDMISTIRLNEKGQISWIYVMRNPDKIPIESH